MTSKPKVCLVCCSVLKKEIQELINQGKLDVELVFVSKNFHVDYEALEKNLRKVLEYTKQRFEGKVVLVYGDLCLGQDNEMKKLAGEYGVAKVDAVNCIDCQLGGGGVFFEADPEHNLMFMGPGMIEFFRHMKEKMLKEGVDEAAFRRMFSGIKGFVLLDTCGEPEKYHAELEALGMGVEVLETKSIGLENVRRVILNSIDDASDSK